MFIPFLASITATAIATVLIKLGAMSVWGTVLSLSLKAMKVLVIALALYVIWARRSAR